MFKFERPVLTAALFLLSTIIIGCGTKEGPAPPAAAPASQPAPASAPAPAPAAAAAPAAPSAPSAATEGDIPGVRVAITELKRTSSSVTLKFTLYNTSAATSAASISLTRLRRRNTSPWPTAIANAFAATT